MLLADALHLLYLLAAEAEAEEDGTLYTLLNEQLLLIATIVGAIATLPTLIEFYIERRKRRERIALSLDDVEVEDIKPRLAGMDDLLAGIADLIDRAQNPQAYADLKVGNEILIIGPSLSGKKTLAQRIAKDAHMDRLVTVYNPRNADALAKAKSLIHGYKRQKVMLLIPRIDTAFEQEDEELTSELEALIETSSEMHSIQVVGTAVSLEPDSDLDNLFGIKLVLPGSSQGHPEAREVSPEATRVLSEVANYYIQEALKAGYQLDGIPSDGLRTRILEVASNPAEIEDIVVLCQTLALHRRRTRVNLDLRITPDLLETAIARVIVGSVSGSSELARGL